VLYILFCNVQFNGLSGDFLQTLLNDKGTFLCGICFPVCTNIILPHFKIDNNRRIFKFTVSKQLAVSEFLDYVIKSSATYHYGAKNSTKEGYKYKKLDFSLFTTTCNPISLLTKDETTPTEHLTKLTVD